MGREARGTNAPERMSSPLELVDISRESAIYVAFVSRPGSACRLCANSAAVQELENLRLCRCAAFRAIGAPGGLEVSPVIALAALAVGGALRRPGRARIDMEGFQKLRQGRCVSLRGGWSSLTPRHSAHGASSRSHKAATRSTLAMRSTE